MNTLAIACLLLSAGRDTGCVGPFCRPEADSQPAAPHPAVVRIENALGGGVRCYGSGTLVQREDRRGLVLTCNHLFRDGAGSITVRFAGGPPLAARLLQADSVWDLAVLEIADPPTAPVVVAPDAPRPGEPLTSCGYGPEGRYACNAGRALGYARTTAAGSHETLELSGAAREGDSGGPVFNARGELVAVIWGTDGRTVEATYCGRVRKFLSGLAARLPRGPAEAPIAGKADPVPRRPESDDRWEQLRTRVDAAEQAAAERFTRVERALELAAGLHERLERAEAAVGAENLRAAVRQAAEGILGSSAVGGWEPVIGAVLAALGWTGPPSIAAIVALKVLAALVRRRAARRNTSRRAANNRTTPARLHDGYAEQLAGVYELSGHSAVADATLGRQYDEELRSAERSSDAVLARWAKTLRQRVARSFYRIHSASPSPAEPSGEEA